MNISNFFGVRKMNVLPFKKLRLVITGICNGLLLAPWNDSFTIKYMQPFNAFLCSKMLTTRLHVFLCDSGLLDEIYSIVIVSWNNLGELLVLLSPFLMVFAAFVAFVCWNGSIVLGMFYIPRPFVFTFQRSTSIQFFNSIDCVESCYPPSQLNNKLH